MDNQQLKLLAGRVRDLLQQQGASVGHSQSLDLISSLAGLRNWPEVQAFPEKVGQSQISAASIMRLTYRVKRQFGLDLSSSRLLSSLQEVLPNSKNASLDIWPSGEKSGVYVATTSTAIDALIANYLAATDGALYYSENYRDNGESCIVIGENGLWAEGLSRSQSGTLIVVGPLKLDQQSWEDCVERIGISCLIALEGGQRVAVHFETPTPEQVCEDVMLMLKSYEKPTDKFHEALVGVVSEVGELHAKSPFTKNRPPPVEQRSNWGIDAIPESVRALFRDALASCSSGVVLLGSSKLDEHRAIELVAAAIPLTDHLGPVARIMPRHRSTPSKDWDVPEPIKQLPYLPSIESAIAQGYKRLIVDMHYTKGEMLEKYGNEVLFIGGRYSESVKSAVFGIWPTVLRKSERSILEMINVVLALRYIERDGRDIPICDLMIPTPWISSHLPEDFEKGVDYLDANRTVKWEDELEAILSSGDVSAEQLMSEFERDHELAKYLTNRQRSAA